MLTLPSETPAVFLAAAHERFAEGTLLLSAGHHGGSVYLFGYVGELVIKAVAFRHYSYGPNDEIVKKDRTAIESLMTAHTLVPQGSHDILRWTKWVVLMKQTLTGVAYPLQRAVDIEHHAGVLDAQWLPSLRYHVFPFAFADVSAVQHSAQWLLTEAPSL